MADYKTLINNVVGNVFANQLGGLTVDLCIRYLVSVGRYDSEADEEIAPVHEDLYIPNVIKARTSFEDVRERGATLNTTKYVVPGQTITREFDASVDRIVTGGTLVNGEYIGGKEVNISKVVGVPDDFVWLIYTNR